MGGELIGLVAVTLGMGVPLGALYTIRVASCAAKTARGDCRESTFPGTGMNQAAAFRRSGILLVSGDSATSPRSD